MSERRNRMSIGGRSEADCRLVSASARRDLRAISDTIHTRFVTCAFVRRQHDNKVLNSSKKYLISLDNDQKLYYLARLEINDVNASDKGEYQIMAKNTLGEVNAHVRLNFTESEGPPK